MKTLIFITLTVLVICFQNFNFVDLMDKKNFVDEEARVSHAKEILGKKYRKSLASKLEGEKFFHVYLYDLALKKLPEKYKKDSNRIVTTIINESREHGIDPVLIASIIQTESSFNPEAKGLAGEIGLMQIMPSTAQELAHRMKIKWKGNKTLQDPVNNIRIGTKYIANLRGFFDKKPFQYLSAYNVGPGKILKRVEHKKDLPMFYSTKVLKYYEEFYRKIAASQIPNNLAIN